MSDVTQLARMVKELDDQLAVCMRCGLCQAVCPLYAQTGRETDVARGKLALLDGLAKDLLDEPQAARERLERCLLCGSCAANCPSGVKVVDIFLKARAILAGYLGLSRAKRLVLRGLLANPGLMRRLLMAAPALQGLWSKPVDELLGTSCARLRSPLLGDRHFKRLASRPFMAEAQRPSSAPGASGLRVGYFVGCLIDNIYPEVGRAAMKALKHHGVGVVLPQGQACCGIPALSSGDLTAFAKLLKLNLEQFSPSQFDYLLTACATCTSTIKKVWPLMARQAGLSEAQVRQTEELAAKTLDISQFLVNKFLTAQDISPEKPDAAPLTYHDPCHLKKSQGVWSEPRRLIRANPAWRLKEMAEPDWCCGMGGSFNLQHYETSASIGQRKLANIEASGCQAVATSCPACMLQITDALSRAGVRIEVKHALVVYAEAL
jgi:glycolate oxidase iron-sulfur subunit